MDIIIVGCGKVGEALARELNEEGNNITVVDEVASKVKHIATKYDIMGVIGNGATHQVQKEAGVRSADLLIAVTGSDELNLLTCLMAKKTGECQTIARVRNPEYRKSLPLFKEDLGLAMIINPEQTAAMEMARVLRFPSAIQIDTFAKGRVEILKFKIPEGEYKLVQFVNESVFGKRSDLEYKNGYVTVDVSENPIFVIEKSGKENSLRIL